MKIYNVIIYINDYYLILLLLNKKEFIKLI